MQLSIELHPVQVEHHSLSDGRLLVGQKVVPLATSRGKLQEQSTSQKKFCNLISRTKHLQSGVFFAQKTTPSPALAGGGKGSVANNEAPINRSGVCTG
ncbi:MAG: hypothetical protein K9M51_02060 [Candidatus Gracilibacteria bacterium]|nr:hypothetical protein [Candidatus Gracilibacteria bacterium]